MTIPQEGQEPQCAHLCVEYRTEPVEVTEADAVRYAASHDPASVYASPRAGSFLTRGWWECRDCSRHFAPVVSSSATATPNVIEDSAVCRFVTRVLASEPPYTVTELALCYEIKRLRDIIRGSVSAPSEGL